MADKTKKIDAVDTKIIKLLQINARTTASDIAENIGMSVPAVSERLRKLENSGIIERYTAILNNSKLGKEVMAIMLVAMGNPDLLYTKAVLDGISSIIFGAVFGGAVFLSAGSVVLYQGTITLLAGLLSPYLSDLVVFQMSLVGSAVLTLLAFDMWGIKKFNVANMIPAAFMPFFFSLV